MTARGISARALPALVCAIVLGGVALKARVPLATVGVYVSYLLLVLTLPGLMLWRLIRTRLEPDRGVSLLEDTVMGTLLGFAVQLPAYVAARAVGLPLAFLAIPAAVIVGCLVTMAGRRAWTMPSTPLPLTCLWGLSAAVCYAAIWLSAEVFALSPLTNAGRRAPYVDEHFHLALVGELSLHMPGTTPHVLDAPLYYHWFVHAHLAATSWATRIEPVVLLRVLSPLAMVALTVAATGIVAMRLSGRAGALVLAPGLLVVVGSVDLTGLDLSPERYLIAALVWSPTQTYGSMLSLLAMVLVLERLSPGARGGLGWLLLMGCLLVMAGAKATFLPIFVAGSLVAVVVTRMTAKRFDRNQLGVFGCTLVAMAFAQFVLFGGETQGLGWNPMDTSTRFAAAYDFDPTPLSTALMTMTVLICWGAVGAGAWGVMREGMWKDPRVTWLLGGVVAAFGATFAFTQSGLSQLYFQRSVAPMVVVVSTWGLMRLLPAGAPTRLRYFLLATALVAGVVAYALNAIVDVAIDRPRLIQLAVMPSLVALAAVVLVAFRARRLRAGPDVGRSPVSLWVVTVALGLGLAGPVRFAADASWTETRPDLTDPPIAAGGLEAARWLRQHSEVDDVVATNVHCNGAKGPRCDNRSFWIPAYAYRRVLVQGWGYTAENNAAVQAGTTARSTEFWDPERLALNDAVFLDPSPRALSELTETYGIDWLLVDTRYPVSLSRLAGLPGVEEVYRVETYVVFRVSPHRSVGAP